jgi:hypothetical protein
MAANNVTVLNPNGLNQPASIPARTDAGSTAFSIGDPVKVSGNYVTLLATAEPTTTDTWLGVAANDSNHTASLDGTVDVVLATPGVVFQCMATTPANVDTDAKLLGILFDRVAFDLNTGVFTVDEDQGDSATNGLRIIGADITTGMIYFTAMVESTDLF